MNVCTLPVRSFKINHIFQSGTIDERKTSIDTLRYTSANDIFKYYESNGKSVGYDELCSLFNNLGHVVIPFDKTEPVY